MVAVEGDGRWVATGDCAQAGDRSMGDVGVLIKKSREVVWGGGVE